MKHIDTLLEDIKHVLENNHTPDKENLDRLSKDIVASVIDKMKRDGSGKFNVRFSNIGQPNRYLYYSSKAEPKQGSIKYDDALKFLIGDIYEAVLLFLIREAGHTVTHEQQPVTLEGMTGRIDALVDGNLLDVKSASSYAFKDKFVKGNLINEDHWGYLGQLSGYAEALAKDLGIDVPDVLILGADKSTGELATFYMHNLELINAVKRIQEVREIVNANEPPAERCYSDVPEGKSGNKTLAKNCTWCQFKVQCWPGLRAFKYSNGVKYLTHVEVLPKVEEINLDGSDIVTEITEVKDVDD